MTATAKPAPVYVVLDLETDDANFDRPIQLLEVAALAVDPATLDVTATINFSVEPRNLHDAIAGAPPVVRDMHKQNGLWRELFEALLEDEGMPTVAEADEYLAGFFESIGAAERSVILCGFSVGTFDHRVIHTMLPRAAKYLSHRTVDIGAIARDLTLNGVEVAEPKQPMTHRAMQDCIHELEVWRLCRAAVRKELT